MSAVASFLLGLFYAASGALKLWRFILPDVHDIQTAKFVEFAKVFPLRPLGYTPEPKIYMSIVGYIELGLGVCLALGPRFSKRIACIGLMLIMTGAAQTLIFNKEYPAVAVPTVFFVILYWLHGQLATKPKED